MRFIHKVTTATLTVALLLGFPAFAQGDVLEIEPVRRIQFETTEGTKMAPNLSPDGRTIVFEVLGDLYLVDAKGGQARVLTSGMALDHHARWSPDGKSIAFISDRDGTYNIWVMNADGTGLRNITRQDPLERPKTVHRFMAPSWSPDGQKIVTGVSTEKTSLYRFHDIWEYSVETPSMGQSIFPENMHEQNRHGTEPIYSPDGRFIYYSRRYEQRKDGDPVPPWFQIWRHDTQSKRAVQITDWALGAYSPSLSPNGRYLVYATRHDSDCGYRFVDLSSGEDKWLIYPIDRDSAEDWLMALIAPHASWAPDSNSFITTFDGKLQRVEVPSGVSQEIPFSANVNIGLGPLNRPAPRARMKGDVTAQVIRSVKASSDGERFSFTAFDRIYVGAPGAPKSIPLTEGKLGQEYDGVWTPDGKSIVFAAFDGLTGEGHLYKKSIDKNDIIQLTEASGYYANPAISPDGETIVFTKPLTNALLLELGAQHVEIRSISISGGNETLITESPQEIHAPVSPQFSTRYPERIFFNHPDEGFVSTDMNGADFKAHILVGNLGIETRGAIGGHVRLNQDGKQALIRSWAPQFGAIYSVDLIDVDLIDDPTLLLDSKISGPKVKRITTALGGYAPFWSDNGQTAHFIIGRNVFAVSRGNALTGIAATDLGQLNAVMPRVEPDGNLLLTGARVITMNGDEAIKHGDILIRNNKIIAVGNSGSIDVPEDTTVIGMRGKTVLPGLIDGHAHNDSIPFRAAPTVGYFWQNLNRLAYGVTTVIDPAHNIYLFTESDRIAAGLSVGPRMIGTGPVYNETELMFSANDAKELARRNSEYFDQPIIKSYNVGGRLERQRLLVESNKKNLIAIPETDGSLHNVVSLIQDGHFHLPHGLSLPIYKDVKTLLVRSGVGLNYQFGTLRGEGGPSSVYYFYDTLLDGELEARLATTMPRRKIYERYWRRMTINHADHVFPYYSRELEKLIDAGGLVGLGDHEMFFGLGLVWEVMALASAMKDNRLALKAVTTTAATMVGLDKEIGSIQPGKLADLVILDGDPIRDIKNLSKTRFTMVNGVLYNAMTLAQVWPQKQDLLPHPSWLSEYPDMRSGSRRTGGVSDLPK
ncbi:MAG: amidohydrolase family protein [Pseudomonadota bacterium]